MIEHKNYQLILSVYVHIPFDINYRRDGIFLKKKKTTSHHEYDYDFIPPAEAPVFSPKPEEFKDALAYFDKIR